VDEDTPPAPPSAPGEVLVEAEALVRGAAAGGVRACVVRLSGLYGPGRLGVVERVRRGALALGPGDGAFMNFCHLDDALAAVVAGNDIAVATSGEYERGRHILDPRTGEPPSGLLSVTVVGPDLATADAYATAIFAMGAAGPEWALGLTGYEALCITDQHSVLSTPGFARFRATRGTDQ
jgi:hypothetical protein